MSTRTMIDSNYAHNGGKSLRVFYPEDEVGPIDSGAQAPFALTPGQEYYLSYWVRFSNDFSWGTTEFAGKLGLGLAGGAACSGGQVCTGYNGFSSRIIWRSGGQAAIYYYHMGNGGQYGDYRILKQGGNDIYYQKGQWINIVQRLKVNTVSGGNANPDGEIQIWYNGVSAANITGLRFVRNSDKVDKAYFSSFFGGATASFAPANDSYIWYDDIKVSTTPADICELSSGGCSSGPSIFREAENYTYMSGIMTEPTPDVGGGLNVGGIDAGDWVAYAGIPITSGGTYLMEYRVASPNTGGKISLDLGGGATVLGHINVPNTGSWSNYQTISHQVQIPAGTHQFGIYAVAGGFDINWWRLTKVN
ncbi:carbohydrate-binding protein [Paenibacillus sp. IB182496]|uniref:Carbohydrate-binding protein n=2 Tax=Paenibacillus sabuli TaxID=2772509 RepID=A0A927GT95_9BACL|nr:carbohydrate-binding protein [Paenibacillus sabuli]